MSKVKYFLKQLYTHFTFGESSNFRKINIEDNKKYINSIYKKYEKNIASEDNLESYFYRSFLQYKCQIYGLSLIIKFINNLISVIAILIFTLIIGIYSLFFKSSKQRFFRNNKNAIFARKIKEDLIPYSVCNKCKIFSKISKGLIIDNNGFIFLKYFLKLFWFEPYFILKCMVKISFYGFLCSKYNPSAIITSSEYSFTSSVLTAYLKNKEILHINIMHGDALFDIRDSFFRFSECYVWDKHYMDLYKNLYAYEKQFKMGIPPRHKKLKDNKIFLQDNKILKFYWASEKEKEELLYIFNGLNKLRKNGFKIIIRYHPLHKEYFFRYITPYCDNFIIEKPECKDIYNSLLETNYVLATYSTVLLEASMMGRMPVINDYGNNIAILEKLDYILIKNGKYITFSNLLKDCGYN